MILHSGHLAKNQEAEENPLVHYILISLEKGNEQYAMIQHKRITEIVSLLKYALNNTIL